MEKEKEIFLEEEREQKLKDRQVFVNLTRDRPKEIVETEIIDKTIPSPDTKRKDEERYKGHLRDSLLDEAQSEWEEKMQKRKDYAADNFDFAQKESDSIGSSPDLIAAPDKQESKQIVSKPEVIVKSDDRTFTQNALKKESDSSYIKKRDMELIQGIVDECDQYSNSSLMQIIFKQSPYRDVYQKYFHNTISNKTLKDFFEEE